MLTSLDARTWHDVEISDDDIWPDAIRDSWAEILDDPDGASFLPTDWLNAIRIDLHRILEAIL